MIMKATQVKICGLTRPDEAQACAALGADAVGLVFYPPSPRYVSEAMARRIARSLAPEPCSVVGVFVDATFEAIVQKVENCRLDLVQLHGCESPTLVRRLGREGIRVIKTLFVNTTPAFATADRYDSHAYLVECAGGPLPGGNAMQWNWGDARKLSARFPLVLAGGLTAANVAGAVTAACPDAVDTSSAVESSPGRKDMIKVKHFLSTVSSIGRNRQTRRIF